MGATMVAFGGFFPASPVRENSDVLLMYQRNAPPPSTATKVKKMMRMIRHDFMAVV